MSFAPISGGSSPEGPVVGAGIDACLTHARANASSGDLYQDSISGTYFSYVASGSGVLVPSGWAGNTLTLVANAAGSAYITLADTEAAVTGRGFVITESGATASVSKIAGSALIITATGNTHYCTLTFLPSPLPAASKKYLLIMKVAILASPSTGYATFWLNDGTAQRALVPDLLGTPGSWTWANSVTPKGSAACVSGTSATWLSGYYGATGQPLLISAMAPVVYSPTIGLALELPVGPKNSQADYSDMRASAAVNNLYLSVYSNGTPCTMHIFELFLLEVS